MDVTERTLLLELENGRNRYKRLSVFFATICVIDVFGVFPIITLPKSIINCGNIKTIIGEKLQYSKLMVAGFYGIIVLILVCCFQIYTAILLGRCWAIAEDIYPMMYKKNRYPYSALAEITYGKCLANVVTLLLDLTIFSAGIPNLIVASQNLQLLGMRISGGNIDISECYWILIVGMILCPILWLGSPKDMKCICTLSVFMVGLVFLLTTGCLIFNNGADVSADESQNADDVSLWKSILAAYGIIAFQFDIHPTILTIQVDMKEKRKLSKAVLCGYIVTLTMLGVTTIAAFFKYGTNTPPNILEILPSSIHSHFVIALTIAQLYLTSAVSNNALYQHMEDCLCISREFSSKRCVLRTILTILAVILAESVPRFDIVMSFIGSALTGPLMFILPPLFYIKVLALQTKHEEELAIKSFADIAFNKEEHITKLSKCPEGKIEEGMRSTSSLDVIYSQWIFSKSFEKELCVLIILVCSLATLISTYINFTNAFLSYSVFTKPCIYNVSQVLLYI